MSASKPTLMPCGHPESARRGVQGESRIICSLCEAERSPQNSLDDAETMRWALKGYHEPLALEALERLVEQLEALRGIEEYVASWVPDDFLPDQPERRASVWQGRAQWIRAALSENTNPAISPRKLSDPDTSGASAEGNDAESGAERLATTESVFGQGPTSATPPDSSGADSVPADSPDDLIVRDMADREIARIPGRSVGHRDPESAESPTPPTRPGKDPAPASRST